jgi:hypothetical protein
MSYTVEENHKPENANLTAAIGHLRGVISCLGSEMNTKIHRHGIDAASTLSLAQQINALSGVINRLETMAGAVEFIVSLRDDKNAVIAERRYAHGLGEAMRWLEEMQTAMPWAADSYIEEREIA